MDIRSSRQDRLTETFGGYVVPRGAPYESRLLGHEHVAEELGCPYEMEDVKGSEKGCNLSEKR